jgi:hypothetical protein
MDTVFDILTGMGLAAAAGIRPFLPALVAGALASANFLIDFDKTDLSFLEMPGWLLAIVLLLIAVVVLQRRGESSMLENVVALIAVVVGAALFAGALADHSDTWWPGVPAGVLIAGLAFTAARDLFTRVRGRLDPDAQGALVVYADGASLVLAALAILIPPISAVAVGFLAWLLLSGRKREGEKYAGLRILR